MLQRIDHINLVVSDLAASVAFFVDLGFVVQAERPLQGEWIDRVVGLDGVCARFASLTLPGAETVLELLQYNHPQGAADPEVSQPNRLGLRHLAFRVQGIEAWVERLKKKGVTFFSELQSPQGVGGRYTGKKLCYFVGPDGVLLELMEYASQ